MSDLTYVYIPDDNRLKLMAWVWMPAHKASIRAEIIAVDATTRTAYIHYPGYLHNHPVPFSALQSVALVQGHETLQAFGHPPAASVPAWVEYAEADA